MEDKYRITNLEDKYFRVPWYVTVVTGTTGTITPPTGGTLVMNQWPGDVDAKASTIVAGEMPTGITPKDTTGADIVVTMSSNGAWALSGTPTAYPIAIIYYYDVKLYNYNRNRDLGSIAAANDSTEDFYVKRNKQEVDVDYTVGSTYNGLVVGPWTVANGKTFTITNGSIFQIL